MENNEREPIHLMSGLPEWHKKPFLLNKYELKYPFKVVMKYYEDYPLMDIRESIRHLVRDATNAELSSNHDHAGYAHNTEKLIEAIYWMIDEGTFITADQYQKRQSFLTTYFEEMGELTSELRLLLETMPKPKALVKDRVTGELSKSLKKIALFCWEIDAAQSSMYEMVQESKDLSTNSPLQVRRFKTARFIRRWAEAFYAFKAFNRTLEIQIDPNIRPTFTSVGVDLELTLENMLLAAYQFRDMRSHVLLDCASIKDSLSFTMSFEGDIVSGGALNKFPAYELIGKSAIAAAHLYVGEQYAAEIKGTLQCWSSEGKTSIRLLIPWVQP